MTPDEVQGQWASGDMKLRVGVWAAGQSAEEVHNRGEDEGSPITTGAHVQETRCFSVSAWVTVMIFT